ncbi:MAG: gamma-glutamyltransferase, partial [Deltaproteobacteria bacterium]|nr:gamma-glutamyltransferase [Deltaproteobacteria bacterium]
LAARPYRGGVVATQHPYASEAALQMLEAGGNAVDAAVAAAFVLAVVAPYHSGIGGGGFAVGWDVHARAPWALDFRELAPAAAHRDMFVKDGKVVPGLSTDGALSVAVPGAVAGYLELQEARGKLPRRAVLAPAILRAREGFWVSPKYQQMASVRLECLRRDAEAARIFLRPGADGRPDVPGLGTVLRQPELARTLEALAARGARTFYEGPTARALAGAVQAGGGALTEADLAAYRTEPRTPLEGSYRGRRVVTMPPPSAGGLAVVQVLGVLERTGPVPFQDPGALHRLAEALRQSYADRARHLGDPAFTEVPLARLTCTEHLDALARTIDPARATPSASLQVAPAAEEKPKNTSHLSVLDRDGNAVSLTTTVNYAFGSCLVAKGTGVLLNDEMDDFAAQPLTPNVYGLVTGEANAVAPRKRPLSSMSPTLVFAPGAPERVHLVVGAPGGPTIPTTVLQVIRNVVDHGMDLPRAVGHGRVHHQYLPDALMVERYALDPATAAALEARGHVLSRKMEAWGDAEAVMEDPATGLRYAAPDPRNEGAALGQD